jgi:predicted dehydrogenase
MRLGLLGCGVIAYWAHLRVLRRMAGATLVAAADPDPAARAAARRLTNVPLHEGADELLRRPDIDAVVICAPTQLHADLAVAAAEAGKHFYLEKPIATDAADARRVVDAASRARVIAAMGFNRRLHPLYQQARDLIDGGRIGRVRAVQTAFCEPSPPDSMPVWKRRRATGGGVLLDLASHHLDLLRWFLREEVDTVAASLGSRVTEQDSAQLALTMRSGVEVQSYFSFRAGLADYLEFIGERGTLRVDRHSPVLRLGLRRRLGYGVRRSWIAPTPAVLAWRIRRGVRPSFDPSYRRSLQAFVHQALGRPAAGASLLDGVRSLEAVLSAEAAAPHYPVAVPCASS